MMRVRRLGRTDLTVSGYTLGTSFLERKGVDLAEAGAAVALALERGINAIEFGAGGGAADAVGAILKRAGGEQRVHIFSRVTSLVPFDLPSPHVTAQDAYPGTHIRAETEALLKRLGVERLALQQLHAWCPEWLHEGDWLETVERLRGEGKIGGIGISLFDHDVDSALEAVASGAIDCVQVMYNVFDQGAAASLFPLCAKHNVGVIARSPLYFGALASEQQRAMSFAEGDWRRDYFFNEHLGETRERVERLAREFDAVGSSATETGLRFCLSHPAVSTVAVGMRTRRQVEANLQALDHGQLAAETLARLRAHRWLC